MRRLLAVAAEKTYKLAEQLEPGGALQREVAPPRLREEAEVLAPRPDGDFHALPERPRGVGGAVADVFLEPLCNLRQNNKQVERGGMVSVRGLMKGDADIRTGNKSMAMSAAMTERG